MKRQLGCIENGSSIECLIQGQRSDRVNNRLKWEMCYFMKPHLRTEGYTRVSIKYSIPMGDDGAQG